MNDEFCVAFSAFHPCEYQVRNCSRAKVAALTLLFSFFVTIHQALASSNLLVSLVWKGAVEDWFQFACLSP